MELRAQSIKSKTNLGKLSKTNFAVIKEKGKDDVIVIEQLVLSNDFDLYSKFELLKKYKDKGLFVRWSSFKVGMLTNILHVISDAAEKLPCPCCSSLDTYYTQAIHCNRCAVTTEI
jgi:hypothetical protein